LKEIETEKKKRLDILIKKSKIKHDKSGKQIEMATQEKVWKATKNREREELTFKRYKNENNAIERESLK
jgi:hypothetical protein